MAGDTVITIIGNITGDPEPAAPQSGAAVANFTVASTPRAFDRQSNEWKDGETLFMRCSVWRDAAENVAESLQRGTRVIVSGRLKSRSYETKEGEKRTVIEMEVDEVGPSLRYATAKVNKTQRGGGGGGFGGGGQQGGGWSGGQQQEDPWRPVRPVAVVPSQQGRRPAGWRLSRVAAGAAERRPTTSPRSDRPDRVLTSPVSRCAACACGRHTHQKFHSSNHPEARNLGLSTEGEHHDGQARCAQAKKKANPLKAAKVENIDYKDTALLRKFISDRGKIRARRVTGVSVQEQRLIATAVKNAREMALPPYSSLVPLIWVLGGTEQ